MDSDTGSLCKLRKNFLMCGRLGLKLLHRVSAVFSLFTTSCFCVATKWFVMRMKNSFVVYIFILRKTVEAFAKMSRNLYSFSLPRSSPYH